MSKHTASFLVSPAVQTKLNYKVIKRSCDNDDLSVDSDFEAPKSSPRITPDTIKSNEMVRSTPTKRPIKTSSTKKVKRERRVQPSPRQSSAGKKMKSSHPPRHPYPYEDHTHTSGNQYLPRNPSVRCTARRPCPIHRR